MENNWFDQNRFSEWISEYGKIVFYAILILLALILIIFRFSTSRSSQAEKDYLAAQNNFLVFQQDKPESKAALEKLQQILQSAPELHAKYDGRIAQVLLNRGDVQASQGFADRVFKRTQTNHLPSYTDYAQTSLMIAEGKYQEALASSLALKQKMLTEAQEQPEKRNSEDLLFAFNLLRIAFLEGQIGSAKDEMAAWEEFKKLSTANQSPSSSAAFATVIRHFEEGQVALKNYIESREKLLKSQS